MPEAVGGIAGVVVLFHPDGQVADNIRSYLPQLDYLAVVDNSPSISPALREFFAGFEKVEYCGGGVNRGMAAALNIGADKALQRGCRWLLTMDQDSRFEPGGLEALIAAAGGEERIGILSPRHILAGKVDGERRVGTKDVSCVMTSGNLLNLEAYRASGPFPEKLFIDYVDYEYCLRLRKSGYRICVFSGSKLAHSLGDISPRRFLGLGFHPTHHSPTRRYYMTRNRLYVMKKYPGVLAAEGWAWMKETGKFFLFEKDRLLKLRFMGKGAWDFLRNRYGPLD